MKVIKNRYIPQFFSANPLPCVWIFTVFLVFFWHLQTLVVSPSVYPDEAVILDMGRVALAPDTDWSIQWHVLEEHPDHIFQWVGPVLQELALRFGHYSMYGPRIAGVLGGILAATLFLCWLRMREVPKMVAALVALAFLLDPLFVFDYRSGRTDMWVIALCIASCILIRHWTKVSARNHSDTTLDGSILAGAGAVAASAFFVWPSAAFLYPLILLELIVSIQYSGRQPRKVCLLTMKVFGLFIVGATVATLLLIIPIWNVLFESAVVLFNHAGGVTDTQNLFDWKSLLYSFRINFPLLLVVGVSAIYALAKSKDMVIVAGIVTILILLTSTYHCRAVYLVPVYYSVVAIGLAQMIGDHSNYPIHRRLGYILLGGLIVYNIALSGGVRHFLGTQKSMGNDPALLMKVGKETIGRTDAKVYDADMDFYYVGRSLGWKMYRPYFIHADSDDKQFIKFLARVDYAILRLLPQHNVERFSDDERLAVEKAGLKYRGILVVSLPQSGPENQAPFWDRVLLGGGPTYGPYLIFSRYSH